MTNIVELNLEEARLVVGGQSAEQLYATLSVDRGPTSQSTMPPPREAGGVMNREPSNPPPHRAPQPRHPRA